MNNIGDLELNIISCILLKPELMEEIKIEDKYFMKHQRLWQFMKAFYKKFKTFDVQLMYSVCKDKWHIVNYIQMLLDVEPKKKNFEKYQQRLIEQYNENKKDKWIIEKVYQLANDLYVKNIKVDDFQNEVNKVYKKANEIFKEVEE